MKTNNQQWKVLFVALLFAVVALLIRAPGLGKWCVTEDEFYFSQPVSYIIEKGVPELPGGGYYTRGILLQYLTVLPALMFERWEFAIRLLPLIFGVLTVPLFYILCRVFLPTIPSIFATVILSFSSWHIEFSRFARFYTAFQFLFFLFLYAFYMGYWQDKRKYQLLSWLLAFISIFVYEGAIFLPLILFAAILKEVPVSSIKKRNMEVFLVSIFLILANYLVNVYEPKFFTVQNPLPFFLPPTKSETALDLPIQLPMMHLFVHIVSHWYFVLGFLILVCTGIYLLFYEWKKVDSIYYKASIITAMILPLIYQYGLLLFILSIVFLCRENIKVYFFHRKWLWVLYGGITSAFWLVILFLSGNIDKTLGYLIGFPPVKYSVFIPIYENVPVWGTLLFAPVLISVVHSIFRKRPEKTNFLLMIVLYLLMVFPVFKLQWVTTRYFFFFYPLLIVLIYTEIDSLVHVSRTINSKKLFQGSIHAVILTIPLVCFVFTEDFNVRQIIDVSSKEVNFRMGKYDSLSNHWYYRLDIESPASYVNESFREGDVIVLDHVIISRYVKEPFINYINKHEHYRIKYHARNHGKIEKWTGYPMIYTTEEFADLVPRNTKNSLWLITSTSKEYFVTSFGQKNHNPMDIAKEYHLNAQISYKGIDNRIFVWKFSRVI